MPEFFDLYDAQGRSLGCTKERGRVHLDGDWHRSMGIWIVRSDGRLIFQRRSSSKDTRPGQLTATVSGHYAAGETLEEVLREAQEEIGIRPSLTQLIPLGLWRQDDIPAPDLRDRELQDIFFWPLDLPLTALYPNLEEVAGLMEIAAQDVLRLLNGQAATIEGPFLPTGARAAETIRVSETDFSPTKEYHILIAKAALLHAAGERPDPHLLDSPSASD